MSATQSITPTERLVKDEDYYFEDGNCVINVGSHLFNLHQSILKRNSPFFAQMFSLPQHSSGTSDDQPMIVCNDTVESFRELCWVLYANPLDIVAERNVTKENVKKLANIMSLAHKYEFTAIEGWMHGICKATSLGEIIEESPREDVASLLSAIVLCGWNEIERQLLNNLLQTIVDNKEFVAKTGVALGQVLDIAQRANHKELRWRAFYQYLKTNHWNTKSEYRVGGEIVRVEGLRAEDIRTFVDSQSLSALSEEQRFQLYRGSFLLECLRTRLQLPPPTSPCDCGPATLFRFSCEESIRRWWTSNSNFQSYPGPLEFLSSVGKKLETDPPRAGYPTGGDNRRQDEPVRCLGDFKMQVAKIRKEIQDNICNCFLL